MHYLRRALATSRSRRRSTAVHLNLSWVAAGTIAALALLVSLPGRSQEVTQFENDLVAKRRVFAAVGAGFRAVRRGPNGTYYVLTAPAPAVQIYDASGARTSQVPSESGAAAKGTAIVYGQDFDVDRDGRVVVCDRAANAIKIYSSGGALAASIANPAPISVAFLPGGEFAVASPKADHLITGYDLTGKVVRDYGDREEIASRADVNEQVNFGQLGADDVGNTYFSFDYLPEPTVRKYDRIGYLAMEISLTTLEFEPAATSARRAIARSETAGNSIPALHRIISAVGVDPQTQEIWLAVGTLLMRFDRDGQRLASFRTYLPRGGSIEPSQILVEPSRLLIGADPQGIYEFPKPTKLPQ